jgi:AcrR family transcriptional regulator
MSDTREHIIQVAGRLFLQKNYDGVSIQDITQAVGMTKGALYHHFASKEQLFEEVAHNMVGSHMTDFSALPTGSLHGFITALVKNFRDKAEKAQEAKMPNALDSGINFYNLVWDAVRILPEFRASIEKFNTLEHASWTVAIQAAIDSGEIRGGVSASKIAKIFTSVADGVGTTSMFKGNALARYEEILDLWEILYQSLKA